MAGELCPPGWRLTKLGELGEVNRGRSRHRPRYAEHLYGGPYPFIQTGDIRESGGRITSHSQTYSEAGLAQSRLWPAGTLCITIAANIAETAILVYPACFPDSVVGFVADKSLCDARFVEYMFRYLRKRIRHEASGSVQDNINLSTLNRLAIPTPPLSEQKAIVSTLGALDDKIDLNRRMNQALEAIARAMFKSWFTGDRPQGCLLDVLDVVGGGTPETGNAAYWGGGIPWFSVGDSPAEGDVFVVSTEKSISVQGLESSAAQILPFGATIVTARGTVGKLALVGEPMAMNQSCYGLIGKGGYGPFFIYFTMKSVISTLKQRTHGSVFETITRNTLAGVEVEVPPAKAAVEFEVLVAPYMKRILVNLKENETLAALRDTLLPKLLSGEIRIKQAEKMVGEAV